MKRELKVKELQLLDAARTRFLKHTQDQRTSQLHRLDHDIQRKVWKALSRNLLLTLPHSALAATLLLSSSVKSK